MNNSVKILIGTDLFFYEELVSQITNPDYEMSELNDLSELFQTCNNYQLIILDLNDPIIDWMTTISQLKEIYCGKTIVFAGYVQKKLLRQAKDLIFF